MNFFKSYHPYAIITILGWSAAYVLTRLALRYFTPMSIGGLRYLVAVLVMIPICLRARLPLPAKKDIPLLIASGATGFFLYMVAFNTGTQHVTAATSSVIVASAPVLTALMAAFLFGEKLKPYQWVAIAIEFSGILVLTVYGAVLSLNRGVFWLLLAALCLGTYNLLQRKLTRTYTALQSTAYSLAIGAFMLAIFLPQAVTELAEAPLMPLVCVLFMGIFSSAIAYITWAKAFEKAEKTSMVSNYMFFTPFISGVLGFVLAGEAPEPSTWIGGVLIISGALLFNRESLPRPAAKKL